MLIIAIVGKHPESSDEEIFPYRDGRCSLDVPAGGRPVCPNDEHGHGDSARGYATRSAATSATRGHDGAGDNDDCACSNDDGARGNSTPGDGPCGLPVTGAGYGDHDDNYAGTDHVDVDVDRQGYRHEEKEDFSNHHPAGGPEVDRQRDGALALSQPGAEAIPAVHSVREIAEQRPARRFTPARRPALGTRR
jgi:hypothetical protein